MKYAPYVRIFLRYVVGAGLMGSAVIGERLAADPDIVMLACGGIGLVVEWLYHRAQKTGGAT